MRVSCSRPSPAIVVVVAVLRNLIAEWLVQQITAAFPWDSAPKHLIRDNDRGFGVVFKARVRAMGIRDRPRSFRSPWQNRYAERLIGPIGASARIIWSCSTQNTFGEFLRNTPAYYNKIRTHLSLGKDAPCTRAIERFGDIVAHPILGGLDHRYTRI